MSIEVLCLLSFMSPMSNAIEFFCSHFHLVITNVSPLRVALKNLFNKKSPLILLPCSFFIVLHALMYRWQLISCRTSYYYLLVDWKCRV